MKTTSIFILTGALSIALLTAGRFQGNNHHVKPHQTAKKTMLNIPMAEEDFIAGQFLVDETNTMPAAVKESLMEPAGTIAGHDALCLDSIIFIEAEDTVVLGFDVNEYLPADFDPYATASLDLSSIPFIEEDDFEGLGFDTFEYLPIGFDAYAGMEPDFSEIKFIADEEPIELGFDTRAYLPEGFNPYALADLQLEDIAYLETEEPIELGFDVDAYLPADFNPYATPEFDLDQIIFIEEEEEIELWKEDALPAQQAVINF